MTTIDVDRYLNRIAFNAEPHLNLETLQALQQAHMTAVPFENLDVYHRVPVRTDVEWSYRKIVMDGRGGWCFENNGAFAALLEALGFKVARLGAAVLLGGPNRLIDHLTLEVNLDQPYLVDVGFGESFTVPLTLNQRGPQDGGSGMFEFVNSPDGVTLTRHDDQGVPEPQFRFRRVNHTMADFTEPSDRLWSSEEMSWRQKPFATRLLDGGPDRVTLLKDRLKFERDGAETVEPVDHAAWPNMLQQWFGMDAPETRPG